MGCSCRGSCQEADRVAQPSLRLLLAGCELGGWAWARLVRSGKAADLLLALLQHGCQSPGQRRGYACSVAVLAQQTRFWLRSLHER